MGPVLFNALVFSILGVWALTFPAFVSEPCVGILIHLQYFSFILIINWHYYFSAKELIALNIRASKQMYTLYSKKTTSIICLTA